VVSGGPVFLALSLLLVHVTTKNELHCFKALLVVSGESAFDIAMESVSCNITQKATIWHINLPQNHEKTGIWTESFEKNKHQQPISSNHIANRHLSQESTNDEKTVETPCFLRNLRKI